MSEVEIVGSCQILNDKEGNRQNSCIYPVLTEIVHIL